MRASPSALSFVVVCEGPAATVRLGPHAIEEYNAIQKGTDTLCVQRRTHINRYLSIFCSEANYRRYLSDEKFKKEDDFSDGRHGKVAVSAFKAWKWRLYGSILIVGDKRCFVGVRVDSQKKQNNANQRLMKSAAKDIGELSEYLSRGED
jgi:hypothetical protein